MAGIAIPNDVREVLEAHGVVKPTSVPAFEKLVDAARAYKFSCLLSVGSEEAAIKVVDPDGVVYREYVASPKEVPLALAKALAAALKARPAQPTLFDGLEDADDPE